MRIPAVSIHLAACLALGLSGCVRTNSASQDGGTTAPGDGAAVDGSGNAGAGYPTRAGYCAGKGPPIIITGTGAVVKQRCTGKMAQTAFRYALCSCKEYGVAGKLKIDSFDSNKGGYAAQKPGAAGALGINGLMSTTANVDVGGAIYVGSKDGITMLGDLTSRVHLHSNGGVLGQGALSVLGDARVRGDMICGDLEVGGTLTQPVGALLLSQGTSKVAHKQTAAVSVSPPCDCTPQHLFDIAGYVQTYANKNDNVAADFKPDALSSFSADTRLDLPCGRLHLSGISGSGKLTLHVTGRTALFVSGMVSLSGPLVVELDKGAELDLFIEDGISGASGLQLGGAATPARVRLYVGGTNPIALTGGSKSTLGGNIYAPTADLNVSNDLELFGAVFVRRLVSAGAITIHYDQAVLTVGDDCPPDPDGCKSCHDCGGQACINGACGKCNTTADCCAPLVCAGGSCVPPLQ